MIDNFSDVFNIKIWNGIMMEQLSEQSRHMSVEDIRSNPGLITELLLKDQDVSVIFEKRGNNVRYAYLKTYDRENVRILQEAKDEHKRFREKGYTREQAFKDLEEAREEINKYL
ncbi:MAG: hypothetical protein B6245_13845 [Desulfobacteraceae bacterium 4572_88]|nr:MAG: hypothetical protein B6245_13845 [Desulfobacteraceae bacterium 4572_88]RLC10231.1 MAG: hypothetical protein DRI57_20725 [Deltaproteobacteria bacterium]